MIASVDLPLPNGFRVFRFEDDLAPAVVDGAPIRRRTGGHRLPDVVDAIVVGGEAVGRVEQGAIDADFPLRHIRAAVFIDDRLAHIEHPGPGEHIGRVALIARPSVPEVVVMLNRP